MKVYMLGCLAERYAGILTRKLREIDIDKISIDDLEEIAMDMEVPSKLKRYWMEMEFRDNKPLHEWLRNYIKKQIVKKGWWSRVTEEGGYLFIRSGNISFNPKETARIAQAWGRNITGGE